jgi:hypothetical protein
VFFKGQKSSLPISKLLFTFKNMILLPEETITGNLFGRIALGLLQVAHKRRLGSMPGWVLISIDEYY